MDFFANEEEELEKKGFVRFVFTFSMVGPRAERIDLKGGGRQLRTVEGKKRNRSRYASLVLLSSPFLDPPPSFSHLLFPFLELVVLNACEASHPPPAHASRLHNVT